MDDQAQDPQNQPIPNTPVDSVQGADTPMVQPQDISQPQLAAPVGSMHKEAGPARVEQPLAEVLTPSEAEPVLHPEVVEAGVEVSKNPEAPPDLTMHDKKLIDHAPSIAPVPTSPSGAVQLPITEDRAEEVLRKEKNARNSISWIAELVVRMHKKIIGGH